MVAQYQEHLNNTTSQHLKWHQILLYHSFCVLINAYFSTVCLFFLDRGKEIIQRLFLCFISISTYQEQLLRGTSVLSFQLQTNMGSITLLKMSHVLQQFSLLSYEKASAEHEFTWMVRHMLFKQTNLSQMPDHYFKAEFYSCCQKRFSEFFFYTCMHPPLYLLFFLLIQNLIV